MSEISTADGGGGPYRVMVCDDSAVIRGLISRTLETDPEINVVATVSDGQMAINALARNEIEVCILDIEMPVMDGLTALPQLVDRQPDLQVIVASTLTRRNAEISLKALSIGAADYIAKPTTAVAINAGTDFKVELISKVKALGASRRRIRGIPRPVIAPPPVAPAASAIPAQAAPAPPATAASRAGPSTSYVARDQPPPRPSGSLFNRGATAPQAPARPVIAPRAAPAASANSPRAPISLRSLPTELPDVIAIGSSTGGPQALFSLLSALGKVSQPILITQHMPATFTTILAEHIERASGIPTFEAAEDMKVESGKIYVAPGDFHMSIEGSAQRPVIKLLKTPPESYCRPSVNPMLRSLVKLYGKRVLTVILTGMGQDGLKGGEMAVAAGGTIIAQDEASSIVWGMPGAVASAGLCSAVLPLDEIAPMVRRLVTRTYQ